MKKVAQPSNQITCLGIQIDSYTGILKIPDVKLKEVVALCKKWAVQTHATRNQLQKLTGKLLYIHRCVKHARIFINRILTVLRNTPQKGMIQLPSAFFRDINWCNMFLERFNGTVDKHIAAGLRPRTATFYLMTFKLFLAFMVYMNITVPYAPRTIIVYLEYVAQNNFKIASLRNHVSVLKHYFGLFGWPVSAFASRKVQLLLKSVQTNAKMQISVKSVISISLLVRLVDYARKLHNGQLFAAIFLTSCFGFFRLAS